MRRAARERERERRRVATAHGAARRGGALALGAQPLVCGPCELRLDEALQLVDRRLETTTHLVRVRVRVRL